MSSVLAQMNLVFDEDEFSSQIYQEKETDFQEDPLVLACSAYELANRGGGFYSLEDNRVIENITTEIRDHAEKIRKYYSKKLFWVSLSNPRELSNYRKRLSFLLEHRVRKCVDKDSGIYYKLPMFYEEDVIYDEFKSKYKTTNLPEPKKFHYPNGQKKEIIKLEFLKSTVSRQQKRKIERFWFTDGEYLFGINIEQENPLIDMFRSIIENGTVVFETYRNIDRIDQLNYYKLFRFNFLKENNA